MRKAVNTWRCFHKCRWTVLDLIRCFCPRGYTANRLQVKVRIAKPKFIGWDMSKPSRKLRKTKCQHRILNPFLPQTTGLFFRILCCFFYYTQQNRLNPIIIFLDVLIVHASLQTLCSCVPVLQKSAHQCLQHLSTPPDPYPFILFVWIDLFIEGYPTRYFQQLATMLNKLVHTITGNTSTIISLANSIPYNSPEDFAQDLNSKIKLDRSFLLQCRVQQPNDPILIHTTSTSSFSKRTGRRKTFTDVSGNKVYFSVRCKASKTKGRATPLNSEFKNSSQATKPTPPQRGTPGAIPIANEECKPHYPPISPPLGRGSGARAARRRMYRRWRQLSGGNILPGSLGNNPVREGYPLKADHRCTHKGRNVAKTSVIWCYNRPNSQYVREKPTSQLPHRPFHIPLHSTSQRKTRRVQLNFSNTKRF